MLWKLFKHLDGQWKDCSNKHLMATQNGKLEIISLTLFELFDNMVLFEIKCCCVHNDSDYVMFCL